jgi:formylglycine-generating enzyme required for sulfatase activity
MRSLWIIAACQVLAVACGGDESSRAGGTGGAAGSADAGPDADACDLDGDGFKASSCGGDDCDDHRKEVHPGAVDTCDGDDNDCDGVIDQDDACDCAEPPAKPTIEFTERVCLKGGWFWMGMARTDPDADANDYASTPAHRVFVAPYYLDAYEVTNRRYLECMGAGKCKVDPDPVNGKIWDPAKHSTPDMADRPFLAGSALDGEAFCEWAGGWLPSEAQWERAAAGLGDEPRPYPNGMNPPTCEEEQIRDCYPGEEVILPVKVGQKKPNPEGLYDLGGNASEYSADRFSVSSYLDCPDPCKNPCFFCKTAWSATAESGSGDPVWGHAARGATIEEGIQPGLWSLPQFFRSQFRDFQYKDTPAGETSDLGFRCAYPAKSKR